MLRFERLRFDPDALRAQFERFAAELQLDEQQKAKVRAINVETFQQTRALRQAEGAGAPPAPGAAQLSAQRSQITKAREQADQKIMALLRPDQQETFRALLAERRGRAATPARVWVLDNGKPKAMAIFIGVADTGYAELVRGLDEGVEVIVGKNRDTQQKSSGRLLRLGF